MASWHHLIDKIQSGEDLLKIDWSVRELCSDFSSEKELPSVNCCVKIFRPEGSFPNPMMPK